MLARCTRCEKTFVTQNFGLQRCTKCGADVFVEDPQAPGSEAAWMSTLSEPRSQPAPEGVPWDHREELGLWTALTRTVRMAMFEPSRLFASMRYDDTEGIHLFILLAASVPFAIGSLLSGAISPTNPEEVLEAYRTFGINEEMLQQLEATMSATTGPAGALVSAAMAMLFPFLIVYVGAAISHLFLLLFGKAHSGFTGTLKAFAFAMSPAVFAVFPYCGTLVVWCWATVLQVIGLARAQETSGGMAAAAVIVPPLTLCCVGTLAIGALATAAAAAISAAAGG